MTAETFARHANSVRCRQRRLGARISGIVAPLRRLGSQRHSHPLKNSLTGRDPLFRAV